MSSPGIGPSTYDVRALQKPAPATDRFASNSNPNTGNWTFGLNSTGEATHQFGLYVTNWFNSGPVEGVTVKDAVTGAVRDSRTLTDYYDGQYLVWAIRGRVKLEMQWLTPGDVFLTGMFFDPPASVLTAQTVTVTVMAASVADASEFGTATVTPGNIVNTRMANSSRPSRKVRYLPARTSCGADVRVGLSITAVDNRVLLEWLLVTLPLSVAGGRRLTV